MKKLLVVALTLMLLTPVSLLFAEETLPAYVENANALGVQAGEVSGIGLSYHRWGSNLGIQVSGGALYQPIDDDSRYRIWDKVLDYNIGVELQWAVFSNSVNLLGHFPFDGRLYIVTGLLHRGMIDAIEGEFSEETWSHSYTMGSYVPVFTSGFGIGFDFIFFRHFSIPVEFLYAFSWAGVQGSLAEQFAISPAPQIGFRYRW
ncbi:hypothetical protein [Spirochaeta dissipatitropha]